MEELSQLVDGLQLGIAYFGRCLFDCQGEDFESMHNSVLWREEYLCQVGVEELYSVGYKKSVCLFADKGEPETVLGCWSNIVAVPYAVAP